MFNVSPEIWLLIKNYYDYLIVYVQDNKGQISVPFKFTVGVKQGAQPRLIFFNDYINELIDIFIKKRENL